MKKEKNSKSAAEPEKFIENVDYYFDSGLMVLTAAFLLKRGYCCHKGCRNCPYAQANKLKLQQKSF